MASMVAGVVSAVIALAAWQWPQSPDPSPAPVAVPPVTSSPTAGPTAAATVAPGAGNPSGTPLDALDVAAGHANLAPVPPAVRDRPGFKDRPIAISCPSNQTGDLTREVTWLLRGRYLDFRADVHPYYPAGTDTAAATYVFAVTGTRRKTGDLTTAEAGRQQSATVTSAKPLTGGVGGAERLTIRVRCGNPNGVVVLTGATVTPP
ncbi:hypothetical protein Ate01nite_21120 [Actinoplanes teichomyceticus]|nr:hypothetical protein Ate01nite_21120 [Actinoplanes teichomyceticus]